MKAVFLGALAGIVLAMPASAAAQQPAAPSRVAFVNMRRILSETPGYAQADSTLQRELDSYRNEFQRLQQSLDSAANAFQQQATLMSPSARDAKRKDLEGQQQQLEQRGQELQQRAASRSQEIMGPLQNRVVAVIEGIRKTGGYAMVFDVSAQGSDIVTADRGLDLTDQVIAQLKKPA